MISQLISILFQILLFQLCIQGNINEDRALDLLKILPISEGSFMILDGRGLKDF